MKQLDVHLLWRQTRKILLQHPRIKSAIEELHEEWQEIARFAYNETRAGDADDAREQYDLDLHIGRVKVKDLSWLASEFEGADLAELALAIAMAAFPDDTWEIVEKDDLAVVTDLSRSTVIDIKNGKNLSAACSLFLAGDTILPDAGTLHEAKRWYEQVTESIERMNGHLQEMLRASEPQPPT